MGSNMTWKDCAVCCAEDGANCRWMSGKQGWETRVGAGEQSRLEVVVAWMRVLTADKGAVVVFWI